MKTYIYIYEIYLPKICPKMTVQPVPTGNIILCPAFAKAIKSKGKGTKTSIMNPAMKYLLHGIPKHFFTSLSLLSYNSVVVVFSTTSSTLLIF